MLYIADPPVHHSAVSSAPHPRTNAVVQLLKHWHAIPEALPARHWPDGSYSNPHGPLLLTTLLTTLHVPRQTIRDSICSSSTATAVRNASANLCERRATSLCPHTVRPRSYHAVQEAARQVRRCQKRFPEHRQARVGPAAHDTGRFDRPLDLLVSEEVTREERTMAVCDWACHQISVMAANFAATVAPCWWPKLMAN